MQISMQAIKTLMIIMTVATVMLVITKQNNNNNDDKGVSQNLEYLLVRIIRAVAFWCLYWVPLILRNYTNP